MTDEDMLAQYRCPKCAAWDKAAKEFGFAYGMCEECFNEFYVHFELKDEWGGTMRCSLLVERER